MNTKQKSFSILATVGILFGTFVFAHGIPYAQVDTSSQIVIFEVDELTEKADLIVIGTVTNDKTIASNSDTYPAVRITSIESLEIIKGSEDAKAIEVREFGSGEVVKDGLRYDVTVSQGVPTYEQNERVLLFLDYDEGNALGDGYYVISGAYGKYSIDGNTASHLDSDRTEPVAQLKQKISNSLGPEMG